MKWNASWTCIPASCADPPDIPNANEEKTNGCRGTPHGATCDMACASGYNLEGEPEVECSFGSFQNPPLCMPEGREAERQQILVTWIMFSSSNLEVLPQLSGSDAFHDALYEIIYEPIGQHVAREDIKISAGTMLSDGNDRRLQTVKSFGVKFDIEISLQNNEPGSVNNGRPDLQLLNIEAELTAIRTNTTLLNLRLVSEMEKVGLPIPDDFNSFVGEPSVNVIISLVPLADQGFVFTTAVIIGLICSILGLVVLAVRCYFFQIKRKRRKRDKIHALESQVSNDLLSATGDDDSDYGP